MEVRMAWRLAASLLLISLTTIASPQGTGSQRIRVAEKAMAERLVTKAAPVYPLRARQARVQGTVILKVEINKSGSVESMQVVSGHPMLAPAAVEAVKQWEYKPYLLNGEAVDVETRVMVNFTLAGNPPAEGVVGDMPGGIPRGEEGGIISSVPAEPARPGVVRVSQGVMAGLLASKVAPDYPVDAKQARIQGTVVMRVIVDNEGNVANIQLISGHPLLAPAAIDAVKQWKYRPYLLDGMPVEIETQVAVNFTLAS
jgi:TonB family protein